MKLQYVFWMLVIGLTAAIITADAEKRDYWEAIVEQWAERGYIMPKPPARIDTGAIVIDGESNTYSINGNTIEIEPPSVSATGAAYDLVAHDPNAIRRLVRASPRLWAELTLEWLEQPYHRDPVYLKDILPGLVQEEK